LTVSHGSEQTPFYTPNYVKVTRRIVIPSYDNTGLGKIDLDTGLTKADEILEFCKQPRTSKEIYDFIGMTSYHATRFYIKPLIECGKLKPLYPESRNKCIYVNAESEIPTATDDEIIAFCLVPRTKGEIKKHFDMSNYQAWRQVGRLVDEGKLLGMANTNSNKNHWQKYVSHESNVQTREQAILEFCQEPRTRQDIADHFKIHLKYVPLFLKPILQTDKLKLTKQDRPTSIDQKYVCAEIDVTILSDDAITEFCTRPRTRTEIAEKFGIVKRHTTQNYINALVRQNKIKPTNLLSVECWGQKFVKFDVEVKILSEQTLLEFCQTPRTVNEITAHFEIATKNNTRTYIRPLVKGGKLLHTHPELPTYKLQKFYAKPNL